MQIVITFEDLSKTLGIPFLFTSKDINQDELEAYNNELLNESLNGSNLIAALKPVTPAVIEHCNALIADLYRIEHIDVHETGLSFRVRLENDDEHNSK